MRPTTLHAVPAADPAPDPKRGPFPVRIGGRDLLAMPDRHATHGWRFFEARKHALLGTDEQVETIPPAYADVMKALTGRESE